MFIHMSDEMGNSETTDEKLEKAAQGKLHLRDATGCLYQVESFDKNDVYITADESETYRISRSQLETFRFVKRKIVPQ